MRSSQIAFFVAATLISSSAAVPVAQLGGGLLSNIVGITSTEPSSSLSLSSSISSLDGIDQTPTTSINNGLVSGIATSSVQTSGNGLVSVTLPTSLTLSTSGLISSSASMESSTSSRSTDLSSSTTTAPLLGVVPRPIVSVDTSITATALRTSTSSSRASESSSSNRVSSGSSTSTRTSTSSRTSSSTSSRVTSSSSRSSSSSKTSTVLTTGVAAQTPLSTADVAILQLALYLEHLEGTLYSKGYTQFNEQQFEMEGFARPFRDNVGNIAKQEAVHAATISSILVSNGITPVQNCSYNFTYPSVKSFIAAGNMVSTAGVGAYLAGGAILKDNAFLLGAASSILTVEARHDAYIRGGIGANPYPSSFDTIVPAPYAYNLAQAFVLSCPTQLNYPIYPKLSLASPVPKPNLLPNLKAGQNITFAFNPATIPNYATLSQKPLYLALLNSASNVSYTPIVSCGTGCASILLPAGLSNIAFVVMTNLFGATLDTLVASGTLAGPCELPIN